MTNPHILGVTFDAKMTWKHHISKTETKARRKLAILRKLSGTTWGANERILKNVYQQAIRPHLEYGSTAWSSASNTTLQNLDKVQNQALRIMTGAMISTPIVEMQNIQGMQSLKERRDTKIIIHGEKFLSHHCHPMKERFQNLSQGRLKRSSFIHQAKRLRRQVSDLPEVTIPLISEPVHTPWEKQTYLQVTIQTTITGVYGDEQQNDLQKRVAALSFLDEAYPNELWTRVYTDGSAQNAVRNGGSGVYV